MDWPHAIERNRQALLGIVAAIVALLGGREGEGVIARGLRRAVLALLRPAEAAARRLIVVAARGLVAARRASPPLAPARLAGLARGGRVPAFPLFDRWKRFGPLLRPAEPRGIPRIRSFWGPPPIVVAVPPPVARAADDPAALVESGRLRLRLLSLEAALADLQRQARRLARWRAKRAGDSVPRSPLRPGRPPGWRSRPEGAADDLLRACHALACDALRADTS